LLLFKTLHLSTSEEGLLSLINFISFAFEKRIMKKTSIYASTYCFVVLLVGLSMTAWGQSFFKSSVPPKTFKISGEVQENQTELGTVKISLVKDLNIVESIITKRNGKFTFELDFNSEYILFFSKEGYAPRKEVFSLVGVSGKKALPASPKISVQMTKVLSIQPFSRRGSSAVTTGGRYFYDSLKNEMVFDEFFGSKLALKAMSKEKEAEALKYRTKEKELQQKEKSEREKAQQIELLDKTNNLMGKQLYSMGKQTEKMSTELDDKNELISRQEMQLSIQKYEAEKNRLLAVAKDKEVEYANKEKVNRELELRQERVIRNIFIIGFGIVLLLLFYIFKINADKGKKNKEIVFQKDLIHEKNREITQSLHYAQRIQRAILPPQRILKKYLKRSFVFYKPKDIVAGDFYWTDRMGHYILFAACDCTGHGVPGAMISVVCHNALSRSVREFKLTAPADILKKTAEIVIENFSESDEEMQDGMDISLCAYNLQTGKWEWAGANNPLWIIRKNNPSVVEELVADRQPVGKFEFSKPFTNHRFTLDEGDSIYMFSDGYEDQFGGPTGNKKLTKKRFKQLLLDIQSVKMREQDIELEKFLTNWQGNTEQIDDILVIGIRI